MNNISRFTALKLFLTNTPYQLYAVNNGSAL